MAIRLGYALSSEEHEPNRLVELACHAEQLGFEFALVSDHFHPWTDRQGHSPFVWSVLGAMARETKRLQIGTGVTCPTIRIHPAIIAHAAATVAAMMPGRFFLGVGSGENLNEHVLGDRWPSPHERLDMLEEAVAVIRKLWKGGMQDHEGRFYEVVNARIYDLPDPLPPIAIAASKEKAAEFAGRNADALISVAPKSEIVKKYHDAGGTGARYGQVTVCWAETEAQAKRTAFEVWPNAGLPGTLFTELPLPEHFEAAAKIMTEDQIAESVVCGPDPERHLEAIKKFADAGFDHVYIHQVGPDQEGFFKFYDREVLPNVADLEAEEVA